MRVSLPAMSHGIAAKSLQLAPLRHKAATQREGDREHTKRHSCCHAAGSWQGQHDDNGFTHTTGQMGTAARAPWQRGARTRRRLLLSTRDTTTTPILVTRLEPPAALWALRAHSSDSALRRRLLATFSLFSSWPQLVELARSRCSVLVALVPLTTKY